MILCSGFRVPSKKMFFKIRLNQGANGRAADRKGEVARWRYPRLVIKPVTKVLRLVVLSLGLSLAFAVLAYGVARAFEAPEQPSNGYRESQALPGYGD
jgi:hypothetical protein